MTHRPVALFETPLALGETVRRAPDSAIRTIRHNGAKAIVDTDTEIAISLALSAAFKLIYRAGGRTNDVVPRIGRFGIMTPGHPVVVEIVGDCTALQVSLPMERLAAWWIEDHDMDIAAVSLHARHSVEDPVAARLICRAACAGPNGEGEYLRQVAARLLDQYATRPRRSPARVRGGLTMLQLRRVTDRIEDGLAGALTLDMLAAEAGLSPYHFSREFRTTTGRAPYQYVIDRRVARAIAYLHDRAQPIGTIAARVGFSHSSHLSRYVGRALGCSPAQLRAAVLP